MDTHSFLKTVLFQCLTGFSGRAAIGCRPSVAYRILHRRITSCVWSFHAENSLTTRSFIHAIAFGHIIVVAGVCIRMLHHNCSQWAIAITGKTKVLRTPPPRWVSAKLLYVCVSARWWSQWCSRWCCQNVHRPFLRAVRFDYFIFVITHRSIVLPILINALINKYNSLTLSPNCPACS